VKEGTLHLLKREGEARPVRGEEKGRESILLTKRKRGGENRSFQITRSSGKGETTVEHRAHEKGETSVSLKGKRKNCLNS